MFFKDNDDKYSQSKNPAKKSNKYYTYGDMFFELLEDGHDPRAINYREIAADWIRRYILKKYELDCLQNKWLDKTIEFFCKYAKFIWRKHRGKVTGLNVQKQHANFFDKYIDDATTLSPCTCANCSPPEPKQTQTNSSKYDAKVHILIIIRFLNYTFNLFHFQTHSLNLIARTLMGVMEKYLQQELLKFLMMICYTANIVMRNSILVQI